MDDLVRRLGRHGQGRRHPAAGQAPGDGRGLVEADLGQRRVHLPLEPALLDRGVDWP